MHKLILSFRGRIQKVFMPDGDKCAIGRGSDCDIQIDNLAVEPVHAIVRFKEHEASLSNRENCVLINEKKPASDKDVKLARGDKISIGKHTVTYLWENELGNKKEPVANDICQQTEKNGWLQIMAGPKMGRTMPLDKPSLQIGSSTSKGALITCRNDGYYLSHLDNDIPVKVDNHDIGDNSVHLQDGNTIQIGSMEMLFFTQE